MRKGKNLQLILTLVIAVTVLFLPTKSFAVYGGEFATGDPKVVAIIHWKETNQAGCTGALISPRIVMTSAHCLSRNPTDGKFPSYNTEDPKSKVFTEKDAPVWVAAPGVVVPFGGTTSKAKVIAQFASPYFQGNLLDCLNGGKGDCHGPIYDFGILILDKPLSNKVFRIATLEEIRDLVVNEKPIVQIGYGLTTHEQYLGKAFKDGIPRKIVTPVRNDLIQVKREWYSVYPELMLIQTRYKPSEYTCGGDSGIPGWFEKNGEWIYIGASGVGSGPECGSAPDDPMWNDAYWKLNSGDQFDTAQAYPDVIAAANAFLSQQIASEEKAAAELKVKLDAEAKASAELKAAQDLRAKEEAEKVALELKAKQDAEAQEALKKVIPKKITITCIKGKTIKKVTALKPVCPKGYKKKT